MYRIAIGRISHLSQSALAERFFRQAPPGARRAGWLAGRVLLSRFYSPLPDIQYGPQGKPEFATGQTRWFNLSHSGDYIALLLSDEGDVGCDLEVIRPRRAWREIAEAVFSPAACQVLDSVPTERQMPLFWRYWTEREAAIKRYGGSVWQLAHHAVTPAFSASRCLSLPLETLVLAVSTPTSFSLDESLILWQ